MLYFNRVHRQMRRTSAARICAARYLVCCALTCLCFLSQPLSAAEATRQLIDSADPVLQAKLEKLVSSQGLADAAERGDLNLALVIVTDAANPRLAEINGNNMVYAASLPKIAILLGAAVAIEEGRLELTPALHQDMNDMIRYSCNECAVRVLDQVGRQELIEILQSPGLRFYDEEGHGGLWVGKDYGPGSAYQRDPIEGLSHGATAFQAARFYYRLYTCTLVSPSLSQLMLDALADPGVSHKFVKGLEGLHGAKIYRKSGTWRTHHADSMLVTYYGHAYILVALADHPDGEQWLEKLALPLHKLAVAESWAAVQAR